MPGTFGSNKPAKRTCKFVYFYIQYAGTSYEKDEKEGSETTKISDLEKQSTITPTSFVSVIPLPMNKPKKYSIEK